jgi:hypothetical protein
MKVLYRQWKQQHPNLSSLWSLYHVRRHEGIGMSPAERFARGSAQFRPRDPPLDLEQLFYAQVFRLVHKDGTGRLRKRVSRWGWSAGLAASEVKKRVRFAGSSGPRS